MEATAKKRKRGEGGGKGRRKTASSKIADERSLMVSFSKRRKGLFKKAQDLASLCGATVAAIAFSPAGKPFTFGDVRLLIGQAEGGDDIGSDDRHIVDNTTTTSSSSSFSVVEEVKTGECWWEHIDIANMGLEELQGFLDEMQKSLQMEKDRLWADSIIFTD